MLQQEPDGPERHVSVTNDLFVRLPERDERLEQRTIAPHDWLFLALQRPHDLLGEEEGDWPRLDVG